MFTKEFKSNDIARVFYSSWKKDFKLNKAIEERGIVVRNTQPTKISDFIVIYDQLSDTFILKEKGFRDIKECDDLIVMSEEKEIEFRDNLINENRTIAFITDLEPYEDKRFIIKCL